MKKIIFFVVLSVFIKVIDCLANETSITLIKVSDGDTIKVLLDDKKENIRLSEIDCFETSKNKRAIWQSEYYHISLGEVIKRGLNSKEILKDKLKNQSNLKLKWQKRDKYKRILGKVYLEDGTSINDFMLNRGGCELYVERRR